MLSVAQSAYDAIAPVAKDPYGDLATLLGSLGDTLFQDVEDLAGDGPNGEVGWSILLDVDRIPDEGLPWLAQWVGIDLPTNISLAAQRQMIRDLAGWKKGSPDALRAAVKPYLTGSQSVVIRERFDPANPGVDSSDHIMVITYTSQTPDPTAALNALITQKDAGLILHYSVLTGQDYESLKDNYATYQALKDAYVTYAGIRDATPGL